MIVVPESWRYEDEEDADVPSVRPTAGQLQLMPCGKEHAVRLVRCWHSRLPRVQSGPWMFAFKAAFCGRTYAVALWHNPSARLLPNHWLELRRMACAPDAPWNTASRMLGQMTKWFSENVSTCEKLISYQDVDVHRGTIYLAANWTPEYYSRPRARDRSKNRTGTKRKYRTDLNTVSVASSGKIRWAYTFGVPVDHQHVRAFLSECLEQHSKSKVTK